NTAGRVDEGVERVREYVLPPGRGPEGGREPGVHHVGVRAALHQEQREPYVAPHGGDEQRRAAGKARAPAFAESTWPCALGRTAPPARVAALLYCSIGFRIRSPSDVDVNAGSQQRSNGLEVAG